MTVTTPRAWDYPECPDCETNVFVAGMQSTQFKTPFECHFCGARFGGDSR